MVQEVAANNAFVNDEPLQAWTTFMFLRFLLNNLDCLFILCEFWEHQELCQFNQWREQQNWGSLLQRAETTTADVPEFVSKTSSERTRHRIS